MEKLNLIVLIDDNPADNVYHQYVIRGVEISARLLTFTHSEQGLEYLKKSLSLQDDLSYPVPSLVFLDINMPRLNGFELLDKLALAPDPFRQRKNMKIFMLTTSINPDDYERATKSYQH